ncbi:hypothetical protein GALMADRAFT_235354 [Galerina marginata CBS 339.88]|uniref:Uncharacterized protein n=1 Tax=Galerina marginata (strain CBS 339.88) TaxID=685588 RepID=A0A067TSG4_GALM3|nr:hypothetical protein GALMADRAFT_235354 [Galerina marginata CBS 339.88]
MSRKVFGKPSKDKSSTDWKDASIEGGILLLTLVQEAAAFSPVPWLKQAAGTTVRIVQTVQAVKENKASYQRLADNATMIIAAILGAYQRSMDKENWPPHELSSVIGDLVRTLEDIKVFVEEKVARNRAVRVIYSIADSMKIKEYGERLNAAISKFEVSSHLNINDVLYQVLKNQKEFKDALDAIGPPKTDAEKVLEKVKEDEDRARKREEEKLQEAKKQKEAEEALELEKVRQEKEALEEWRKLRAEDEARKRDEKSRMEEEARSELLRQRAEDEARMRAEKERAEDEARKREEKSRREEEALRELRRLRAEDEARERAERARKEQVDLDELRKLKAQDEARKRLEAELKAKQQAELESEESSAGHSDVLAELEKYRAREREYLEKKLRSQMKRPSRRKVENEEDEETVVDEEESEEESSEDEEELARLAELAKAKKAGKKKAKSPASQGKQSPVTLDDTMKEQFARMGLNPAAAAAFQSTPPVHPSYSPPYGSYFGSPMYGSPSPSPIPGVGMGYPMTVQGQPYSPPPVFNNYNSGNVTNSNISNLNNDYSVRYPVARRGRRKPKGD